MLFMFTVPKKRTLLYLCFTHSSLFLERRNIDNFITSLLCTKHICKLPSLVFPILIMNVFKKKVLETLGEWT